MAINKVVYGNDTLIDLTSDTVTENSVFYHKTFHDKTGAALVGKMPNRSAVSKTLDCGEIYTIPNGYHNGNGTVTANSLASQTGVDDGKQAVTAEAMLDGYQGWVNGEKITGNYQGGGGGLPDNDIIWSQRQNFNVNTNTSSITSQYDGFAIFYESYPSPSSHTYYTGYKFSVTHNGTTRQIEKYISDFYVRSGQNSVYRTTFEELVRVHVGDVITATKTSSNYAKPAGLSMFVFTIGD